MSHLSANLLGALALHLADLPLTNLRYDKVRALLVYLIVESGHSHRRESLAGLLWPDTTERAARQSLSQALLVLRRAIGDREAVPPFLHITTHTLQFNTDSDHMLDVAEFTALIDTVQQHAHPDLMTCSVCLWDLEQATALYRGDFMAGFSLPDCPEFEIWLTLVRERLQQRAMDAFNHLAEAFLLRSNYEKALKYAQRQLVLDNLREPAYRQAMTALAISGQRSAALAQYETCKRVLEEELGIVPEPTTVALYEMIGNGVYSRVQTGKPGEGTQTAKQVALIRNNLPYHVSPFIGRADLLEQVQHRLVDANCRLLTLLGPGGCGKTRLAQETAKLIVKAREYDSFGDGIYFIPLAAIETSGGIVPAIAQAVGLNFVGGSEPDKQLKAYLAPKRILLILDNFEHLVNGARLLVDLLRSTSQLKILVTTRVKLAISAEQIITVPGMAYPDDAIAVVSVDEYSALLLFQQFARRVQPDFSIDAQNLPDVARICQLVHGMPLGLLLASAWMNMLNPSEIADEIERSLDFLSTEWRELPARQRSMRAVFKHTWNLLSTREQRMLVSLAVFNDGWTREAALEVAQVTLRDLLALINRCLVERTPNGRYGMHELLRQFAEEKLAEDSELEQQAHLAYAEYFKDRLSKWWDDLRSPKYQTAIKEIDADLDNARSAIGWLLDNLYFDNLKDSLDCLSYYFRAKGLVQDGANLFLAITERLDSIHRDIAQFIVSLAYNHYSSAQYAMGRTPSAIMANDKALRYFSLTYEQSLTLKYEALPTSALKRKYLADILVNSALYHARDNPVRARHLFAMCHRIYIELNNSWGDANTLHQLASTYIVRYEREMARILYDRAHDLYQQAQDPVSLMRSLMNSAAWYSSYGDSEIAEADLSRAEQLAHLYGMQLDYSFRGILATIYNTLGRYGDCLRINLQLQQEYSALGLEDRVRSINLGISKAYTQLGQYEHAIKIAKAGYEYYVRTQADIRARACLAQLYNASIGNGQPHQALAYFEEYARLRDQHTVRAFEFLDFFPVILYQLERYDEMIEPVSDGLKHTLNTHDLIDLFCTLPMVCLVLLTQQKTERAIEVHALTYSYTYVSNNVWFEDVAGKFVKQAAVSLPEDIVIDAEARGRELDLWETAEALITELEALQKVVDA